MSSDEFIYWRSTDGMDWVLTDIRDRAAVVEWLAEHPDEIYDDGHGNRYRCDRAART